MTQTPGTACGPLTRTLALRYLEAAIAFDRATPRVGEAFGVAERVRFVAARRTVLRAAKLLKPLVRSCGGSLSVDCYLGPVSFHLEKDGAIAINLQGGVVR